MEDKNALRHAPADTGCGTASKERSIFLTEQRQEKEGLALLSRHRGNPLEPCHTASL